MSDEQIAEYLRSRARVRPPMDLATSIVDAVEAIPQRRRSWFAPVAPAIAAVGAAAVVAVAAVFIDRGADFGPGPAPSPIDVGSAPASVEPSPASSPSARRLTSATETVTIDAVDTRGAWGTVVVTRGEDVGGYGDGSVPDNAFVVEVHVAYEARREPEPLEFGRGDWYLVTARDGQPVGELLEPGGRRERARPALSTYPGAIDIFANPLEGWLLFEVPRSLEDQALELEYRPAGTESSVVSFRVREPGRAPDPIAEPSPAPTPIPVTYVEKRDLPFTVIDHAGADELFATPDTCTNPVAGYTVTYPDAWFTNTEIGDWQPCTWFSPTFYEVGDDPNEVPPQVAIVLVYGDIGYGYVTQPDFTVSEELEVAGRRGHRAEIVGETWPAGDYQPTPPTYFYTVYVEDDLSGPTLRATTPFEGAADYELNKAVLDRIMAMIEFDAPPRE